MHDDTAPPRTERQPFLTQRFEEALVFAAHHHSRQARKGTSIPYIAHLMAVSALVLEHGGDEDQAIAALLHDAVEDQGGEAMRRRIYERFGDRIGRLVDGCTDADTDPKPPWRERKEAYLEHLGDAPGEVLLISLADKVHNARAVLHDYRVHGEALWDRFNGGRETLWYYRALADAFQTRMPSPLAAELERAVAELESLAEASEPAP